MAPNQRSRTEDLSGVKRTRGRPPTFETEDRQNIAVLILQYGARGACDVSPVPVCLETILKIAREFNIPLKAGRRPRADAA